MIDLDITSAEPGSVMIQQKWNTDHLLLNGYLLQSSPCNRALNITKGIAAENVMCFNNLPYRRCCSSTIKNLSFYYWPGQEKCYVHSVSTNFEKNHCSL